MVTRPSPCKTVLNLCRQFDTIIVPKIDQLHCVSSSGKVLDSKQTIGQNYFIFSYNTPDSIKDKDQT